MVCCNFVLHMHIYVDGFICVRTLFVDAYFCVCASHTHAYPFTILSLFSSSSRIIIRLCFSHVCRPIVSKTCFSCKHVDFDSFASCASNAVCAHVLHLQHRKNNVTRIFVTLMVIMRRIVKWFQGNDAPNLTSPNKQRLPAVYVLYYLMYLLMIPSFMTISR